MAHGEIASPRAWITKMFSANAVVRTVGDVTFARIVLLGPVLKNRQNTARNTNTHAQGNGVLRISSSIGKPASNPAAETMKYDPLNRPRSRSPAQPPSSVAANPATTVMAPKIVFTCARLAFL